MGIQNAAEFWNVSTRGGLGLSVIDAQHRLRVLERGVAVLADTPATYADWKGLVVAHSVMGVQVHDARIVALMAGHGVTHLLTLNKQDFARYPGITAVEPADLLPADLPVPRP